MRKQRVRGPRFYTTTKSVQTLVAEIMQLLAEYGAETFHVQHQAGIPVAIAFAIHGVTYRIRPHIEGVRARLEQMPRASRATPEAVAWAQARHLIELQLEAIENGVVTASQAFGGLAVTNGGRTVAELLDSAIRRGSPGEPTLLLPGGAEE